MPWNCPLSFVSWENVRVPAFIQILNMDKYRKKKLWVMELAEKISYNFDRQMEYKT